MANQDGGSKSNNGSSKTFTPSDTTDIYRIGVRPPPFWAEEPAVWFSQLEGNFVLSGIKDDDTKFYYVTSTLEHRYAAEVKDIIVSPPKTGKYERLKSELIKRLSTSREKEVKQLLMHEELGDRRPSQFLRHLQQLAGPTVPEEFIKTIWTSRLPTTLQPIIVSQKRLDLLALADLADSVHEIIPCSPQIATTSALKATEPSLASMAKQIDELSRQVKALTTHKHRSRSRTRRDSPDRKTKRSQSSYKKFPTCWYHYKFGNQAKWCTKPCDFRPENYQGSR
ncbi:uncharacterized protein LOC114240364 [Bombyx mandarina]|uniref:DUF7041 domain-containing protein n=2 Tax=Bombyx TaxID=7090 RepID=A0A8R2R6U7_BOMMO|nr:uncharacterized protein LOC114240364 [Bombyx mandarina]XP_037871595.1 uncharacterized protein LOC119629547 [Bombyx mori]XP_037877124.1 uncharacterized protein LOC119630747 [Bombyx mori]